MKKFIFVEARATEQGATDYVRKLGFSPVLFTYFQISSPEYYRNIDRSRFDEIYDIDTRDPAAMRQLIDNLGFEVAGVMGCYDEVMIAAAELAEVLSLPHPDIQGLKNAYHKDSVREKLAVAGIVQPEFRVINLNAVPTEAPLKFPFVIKPLRDAGAFGVHFCRSQSEYVAAVRDLSEQQYTFMKLPRTQLLIEEFIDGNFYGAELLWDNDQWRVVGINKIFVDPDKSLCMIGISHPSDIPSEKLASIEKEILRWVNILGLRGGVINVEFKINEGVPKLIEVNLRLAGAFVNRQVEITTGVVLVEQAINQACGIRSNLDLLTAKPRTYVADGFIFARTAGSLWRIDTAGIKRDNLLHITHRELPFEVAAGDLDFGKILGHVLAQGETCQMAMQNALTIIEQLVFHSGDCSTQEQEVLHDDSEQCGTVIKP